MLNIILIHASVLYTKLNIPKVNDLFKIQICKVVEQIGENGVHFRQKV